MLKVGSCFNNCARIILKCEYRGKEAFCRRLLYNADVLGLEGYKRQKVAASDQLGNLKENFQVRMVEYLKSSEANTIFTEDLKKIVYLAESDSDVDVAVQMVRRFHSQNSDLRFSNFVFGPLVMRLLYSLNKADLAYELFTDQDLSGFFDQMSTFIILMDLLYENRQYDRVLSVMDIVTDKQLAGVKYPVDCMTLALAACYKQNTSDSLKRALTLVKNVSEVSVKIALRGAIYTSMLALTQRNPSAALEILSVVSVRKPAPVAYVNAKVLTYAALSRVDDAIQTLRSILEQDLPDHIKFPGEIFDEVLQAVHDVSRQHASTDVQQRLATTEKALRDAGLVTERSFAEYLDRPILRQRRTQDGYKQRLRPTVAGSLRSAAGASRRLYNQRPGLLD